MVDAIDRHVGRRLRLRRRLMDLTQADLARRVGVSFQQIHKYECATQRMSVGMLCRLAWVLEVEPAYFLAGLPTGGEGVRLAAEIGDDPV